MKRSLDDDLITVYGEDGLVRGETSFIDWREQSYPKWMQTADIYRSEAMSTNMVHAIALQCASEMAQVLGKKKRPNIGPLLPKAWKNESTMPSGSTIRAITACISTVATI